MRKQRSQYKDLADKKGEVREALGYFDTVQDLKNRKIILEKDAPDLGSSNNMDNALSASVVDKFAAKVLELLTNWEFPNISRLHFDLKTKDLVIDGSNRTSFGKGFRALTQAAFSIGLLNYCAENDTPHTGFVVLDSPLLSYKEPENETEDLRGSNLNARFYENLAKMPATSQLIIIENTEPPQEVAIRHSIKFTGNSLGRYGFFPVEKKV